MERLLQDIMGPAEKSDMRMYTMKKQKAVTAEIIKDAWTGLLPLQELYVWQKKHLQSLKKQVP